METGTPGEIRRHKVPGDDSCLFHSIAFLAHAYDKRQHEQGGKSASAARDTTAVSIVPSASSLREVCVGECHQYTEEIAIQRGEELKRFAAEIAVPSDENLIQQYKKLIVLSSTWGDILEARMILEQRYRGLAVVIWNLETGYPIKVAASESGSGAIDVEVGHIVHTGAHFDPLVRMSASGAEQALFEPGDDNAKAQIQAFVDKESLKYQKLFQCDDCADEGIKRTFRSNGEAMDHMEQTGHCMFSNVNGLI